MNPWVILLIAGVCETIWALGLKYANGFTAFWPSVITLVIAVASFVLLGTAMKSLPVGTAYAVWTGIGTLGTAILAVFLFGEPVTLMRVGGIFLIVAGIAALKLA
ncbi:MAG: QacE family quaternary ammonium compound efflux SMR transporter [Rhodobacteraceae bacterium]|nr:QacE family quaternary ammonium compound efflux SMR transporter [Paracoccaceae bacterium]